MSSFKINTVGTMPIAGQKPGTSGLRKKVKVFQSGHYLHNFVQATFNSLPQDKLKGSTLVVGGDGRYWNKAALQIIIKIAAGNGIGKLLIGQDGILSTPAVSAIVRARNAYGALILTASHNPGGPDNDFGIKYNISNGGPAPESITNAIYDQTTKLTQFFSAELPDVDLSKLGNNSFGGFDVEIIDCVDDYLTLLKTIFDFEALKQLIARKDFRFVFDSLSGVTGTYTRRIFVKELGASEDSLQNCYPAEDFNGHHPDPNLTYAKELVDKVYTGNYEFGAASDGDGDRNMVLGRKFFVTPSDSVAVIAAHANVTPYFKDGVRALARSMPTSGALDRVAKKLGVDFYEVPTGWKFFGNIMDDFQAKGHPHSVICGEESFGTGSDHIREKDGLWAVIFWLSILAHRNKDVKEGDTLVSVEDIVQEHWKEFGRNYYSRYDYEEVDASAADELMKTLEAKLPKLVGQTYLDGQFKVVTADQFLYKDPFDGSVTKNQGIRIIGEDGSRIIFRLSGTGSSGATIRLYLEKYESDPKKLNSDPQNVLKDYANLGLELSSLEKFTGRSSPTVIT